MDQCWAIVLGSGLKDLGKVLDIISVYRSEILDPEVFDQMTFLSDDGVFDLLLRSPQTS